MKQYFIILQKQKKVDFHLFHYKCNVISEKMTYTKTSKNEE